MGNNHSKTNDDQKDHNFLKKKCTNLSTSDNLFCAECSDDLPKTFFKLGCSQNSMPSFFRFLKNTKKNKKIEFKKESYIKKPEIYQEQITCVNYFKKSQNMVPIVLEFKRSNILDSKESIILLSILPKLIYIKLIYNTVEHGRKASDFHRCCNGFKGTLVIAKSKNGNIAGGYTDLDWSGNGYKPSVKSFLFSVDNKKIYQNVDKNKAIYCHEVCHPIFGSNLIRL